MCARIFESACLNTSFNFANLFHFLIDQVVEKVKKVVPKICPYKPGVDEAYLPSIDYFVLHVTRRSYATVQELVMSLIYLSRCTQARVSDGTVIDR